MTELLEIKNCITTTDDTNYHILDGALLTASDYPALYSKLGTLDPTSSYFAQAGLSYNFTNVGTPTNDNGIISGFSSSNYLETTAPDLNAPSTWELVVKFKVDSLSSSNNQHIFASCSGASICILWVQPTGYLSYTIGNSSGSGNIVDTAGSLTVSTDTWYWGKIQFTGTAYILSLSTDGTTYDTAYTHTANTKVASGTGYRARIGQGRASNNRTFFGSIDMKNCYIKADDNYIWQGITDKTAEQAWQEINTQNGVCGKFVYDSTNQTVRIPNYGNSLYTDSYPCMTNYYMKVK